MNLDVVLYRGKKLRIRISVEILAYCQVYLLPSTPQYHKGIMHFHGNVYSGQFLTK